MASAPTVGSVHAVEASTYTFTFLSPPKTVGRLQILGKAVLTGLLCCVPNRPLCLSLVPSTLTLSRYPLFLCQMDIKWLREM